MGIWSASLESPSISRFFREWPAAHAPGQELFQVEQGETRLDGAFTLNPEKASVAVGQRAARVFEALSGGVHNVVCHRFHAVIFYVLVEGQA